MLESAHLLNAMLANAFRGTPLATVVSGIKAAGVAGADSVALLTGLSRTIAGGDASGNPPTGADDDEAKAFLLAKAMIAAAKADGEIDDDERLNILNSLAEAGVNPTTRRWVEDEMAAPLDIDALVSEVNSPQTAGEVFTASLMAIKVDTDAERSYLAVLADRLGLAPAAPEPA